MRVWPEGQGGGHRDLGTKNKRNAFCTFILEKYGFKCLNQSY